MSVREPIGRRAVWLALAIAPFPFAAAAESARDDPEERPDLLLAPIVITPTRVAQPSFDVPASVDVIDADVIREDQPQVNLSETLVRVPGVIARNRQNYAQDLQISSRGFGARAPFGVRGVRLLADGIPLTSPDGQGQAATIDLSTAERIEVLRGPFSALYGNSSGGVIAVYTEDPPERPTVSADAGAGSYDTSRLSAKLGGRAGAVGFLGHASRFDTEGYREHSAARRDQWTAKLADGSEEDAGVTFTATALHQPETLDPRGLTRAQVDEDPRQAGAGAIAFNTRKTIRHHQEGLIYESRSSARSSVRLLGYAGERRVIQFLGFRGEPSAAEPLNDGGVIDLDRAFWGLDARFTRRTSWLGDPLTLTAGVAYDDQEERRRGFENLFGTQGALLRDEEDRVYSFDQYAQAEWRFAPRWAATVGARRSEVKFEVNDVFVTDRNPDDSGSVRFTETTPVAGVLFELTPDLNLYANAGRGFETPTFTEIAYHPDRPGLNFELRPSTSDNYEIGAKMFLGPAARLNLALFYIETENEIVVAENVDGRSTFRNAGRTERTGAELLFESRLGGGFGAYLALAYVDAEYAEPFVVRSATIPAGNRIPGVARGTAYGELSWRDDAYGFETAIEARWSDRVFVNDENSEAADAHTVASWRAGFEQRTGGWTFREFARVDNLFDRRYIGSVIVNAFGGRFYEPAAERNYFVGVRAAYRF